MVCHLFRPLKCSSMDSTHKTAPGSAGSPAQHGPTRNRWSCYTTDAICSSFSVLIANCGRAGGSAARLCFNAVVCLIICRCPARSRMLADDVTTADIKAHKQSGVVDLMIGGVLLPERDLSELVTFGTLYVAGFAGSSWRGACSCFFVLCH